MTYLTEIAPAAMEDTIFQTAFRHAAIGMALVSPEGYWLDVNDAVCRLVGYSKDELLGLTFQDITHPDDLAADLAHIEAMLAGRIDHYEMEKRYLRRDGAVVWALLSVSLVRKGTEPLFFISQIQDITERKLLQTELDRKKRKLDIIMANVPLVIARLDRHFRHTFVSAAVERKMKVPVAEILGKTMAESGKPENVSKPFDLALSQVFASGQPANFDLNMRGSEDPVFYYIALTPEFDAAGAVESVLAVFLDVTERRAVEAELRRALEEIKRLQSFLPICSYCKNVRDDNDYWHSIEQYITEHTDTVFSHSICPHCYESRVKPDLEAMKGRRQSP